RRHSPIPAHLPQPVVLLGAERLRDLHEIVCSIRPKLRQPPVPRLSHLRLPPQIVQPHNQFRILRARLFRHSPCSSLSTIRRPKSHPTAVILLPIRGFVHHRL